MLYDLRDALMTVCVDSCHGITIIDYKFMYLLDLLICVPHDEAKIEITKCFRYYNIHPCHKEFNGSIIEVYCK